MLKYLPKEKNIETIHLQLATLSLENFGLINRFLSTTIKELSNSQPGFWW